ncbi:MAG TPA: substrate-binding domain-containing protein [Opitutaceae bacterium]|nr:substrate-binding domain-containing protein [Opitutaceae bacterium]
MKIFRYLTILSLALFVPLSLIGAPKIGVLLKDRDLFWGQVEKGAVEAGKNANVELVIKAPPGANMLGSQLKLLAALEKESLDALVIGPLTMEEFRQPIEALRAKGVKIVAIDTPLPEGLAHTYCGYNQKTMAETAARLFAGLVQDDDEAAILRANSLENISIREKTLLAVLRTLHPKEIIHLDIMAGAEKGDDYDKALLLLDKYPKTKAVITPFSASSMAMIRALKDRKLAGKVIQVGFGSGFPPQVAEAIEAGAMQGWIAQEAKLIGQRGVEAAVALVEGKPVPATIEVEFIVVTKENLNSAKVRELKE